MTTHYGMDAASSPAIHRPGRRQLDRGIPNQHPTPGILHLGRRGQRLGSACTPAPTPRSPPSQRPLGRRIRATTGELFTYSYTGTTPKHSRRSRPTEPALDGRGSTTGPTSIAAEANNHYLATETRRQHRPNQHVTTSACTPAPAVHRRAKQRHRLGSSVPGQHHRAVHLTTATAATQHPRRLPKDNQSGRHPSPTALRTRRSKPHQHLATAHVSTPAKPPNPTTLAWTPTPTPFGTPHPHYPARRQPPSSRTPRTSRPADAELAGAAGTCRTRGAEGHARAHPARARHLSGYTGRCRCQADQTKGVDAQV